MPTASPNGALPRAGLAAAVAGRDAVAAPAVRLLPPSYGVAGDALPSAIRWLSAYPETTGYVLGTLLAYGERAGDGGGLAARAREMGAWEVEVQAPDGG